MRALIAIALLTLFGAGEAAAASCGELRAQLAAAQSGGGGGPSASVRQQYAAYGCNSSSAWGRHRACGSLERQMRGGGVSAGRIRALQSQVAAACASEQRQATTRRSPGGNSGMVGGRVVAGAAPDLSVEQRGGVGGFFGNLFGGGRRRTVDEGDVRTVRAAPRAIVGPVERLDMDEARGRRRAAPSDDADKSDRSEVDIAAVARESGGKRLLEGSTQTVCVRLCDGFYFPINDRSTTANFYEELAMCVGRCPGADVSLYSHGAGTAIESMRSTLTNERYTDLPTAFEYRKGLSSDCGCHAKTVIAGDLDAEKTLGSIGLGATPASADAGALVADASGTSVAPQPRMPAPLLRAVLDETGKPLPPRLTARTVVDGELRSATVQRPIVEAKARNAMPAALPRTGPEPLRLRAVGPQFYVGSEAQEKASQRRRHATVVTTTAVRVVPVDPEARLAPAAPDDAALLGTDQPQDVGHLAPADPDAAALDAAGPQDVGALATAATDAGALAPDAAPLGGEDVDAPAATDAAALVPDAAPRRDDSGGAVAFSSDG